MDRRRSVLLLLALVGSPVLAVTGVLLFNTGLLGIGGPLPEPPGGTLEFRGQSQTDPGITGCWTEKHRWLPDRRTCTESESGFPTEKLRVPEGSRMVFVYGGEESPESVEVRAVNENQGPDQQALLAAHERRQEQRRRGELEGKHLTPEGFEVVGFPVQDVGRQTGILANLPPGEYLVMVSVRVDDRNAEGEAFYSFGVRVE